MLAGRCYVPHLRTKPAEITAYRTLSVEAKDLTFPVFLAKPWQNASFFSKTIEKIVEAVDNRPFAIELDKSFYISVTTRQAQIEFNNLFESLSGYQAYYDFVDNIANAIPVLVLPSTLVDIRLQLENVVRLDRGLIIHIKRDDVGSVINLEELQPLIPNDTVFLIDAGWSRDFLTLEQWTLSKVGEVISIFPTTEVVILSSSFPDSFSDIIGHKLVTMHESRLYSSIRRSFNNADFTYGDWATTRPPQSGGGGKIPPRIDVPGIGNCNIFRAEVAANSSYLAMSQVAKLHDCFRGIPECYGRRLIEDTDGFGIGVTGTQRSTEARISVHMTLHSQAGSAGAEVEIPYED
ncbi:beta family protein [Polymorphobacter sp. PAMC 29334]|uniref:beta family protein n=1 Tax=Polymorphobacter sp. PAMC 29334 TaxID=2862331 RepID=UPI001C75A329|nr:beta family protein [Polymorphobacter sp. PAMC 29334]QYE33982.1 beta family protein [Polymorphobacter sp. PAMC 29334]